MGRKQTTRVTFEVKMELPKGSNVHALQLYIRDAIATHGGGGDPSDPHFAIAEDSFTVRLVRKETTYG